MAIFNGTDLVLKVQAANGAADEFKLLHSTSCSISINADTIDVSSKEFIEILNNNKCPQVIDYISMDVDDASFPCLKNILNSGFEFKCMTFEHTWDLKDPEKQTCVRESRELLKSLGYICLFEDVCLDYGEHAGKPFEDWWVHPLLEVNIEPQKHLTDKKIIALLNDK